MGGVKATDGNTNPYLNGPSVPSSPQDPIERERDLLADWDPETKHTGWQTTGQVGGGLLGLSLGASLGVSMMFDRNASALAGFAGMGLALVGGIIGGGVGAHVGGSLLHHLDRSLPDAEVAQVTADRQRVVDGYEHALDKAERAVDAARTDGQRLDAWNELMQHRPDDLPVPFDPPATTAGDDVPVGDYQLHQGYGVVPSLTYGG